MCDIVFEKAKGRDGKKNRTSVYAETAVQGVLQKRYYEKFRRIHKKTSVLESFFDKAKLCRSATSLKPSL